MTGKIEGENKYGKAYSIDYKYASLAAVTKAILPMLGRHGLAFTARPTELNDRFYLAYSLIHGASNEREDGVYPLPDPTRTDPKKVGSARTYAMRYSLLSATGIHPDEDDDGDAAGQAIAENVAAARRQRRADPEVDRHGAATVAEQTRMLRGPEPGTTRHTATASDEDEWHGAPPADETDPEDRHGTADRYQLREMHALFGALGLQDRDKRMALTRDLLPAAAGLQSSRDLSLTQARELLEKLREKTKIGAPTPEVRLDAPAE
jgi:hypothetical protein